ncbi:hypothetical protein PV326_013914 [Microctonus aethiopoides]|nr:hypothetical protein PV326_013914 [Microctonus aethiopoides]
MDLPIDPDADTGGFKLIFKQNIPEFNPYLGPGLFVFGKPMKLHENPEEQKDINVEVEEKIINIHSSQQKDKKIRTGITSPMISRRRDPKVVDFINSLE